MNNIISKEICEIIYAHMGIYIKTNYFVQSIFEISLFTLVYMSGYIYDTLYSNGKKIIYITLDN